MMISPEGYYAMELKGRNADEIMTSIRKLKKEINHCKKVMENPKDFEDEIKMRPSPATRLYCNRLYLEKAKNALVEAGGVYVPTKKELAAEQFEKELEHLSRFVFTIGGYFDGYDENIVEIDNSDSELKYYKHKTIDFAEPKEIVPSFTKEEFFDMLKELHLGEWKKKYINFDILDGTQWKLVLKFSNGLNDISFSGSNEFPWCFDVLEDFFCTNDEE